MSYLLIGLDAVRTSYTTRMAMFEELDVDSISRWMTIWWPHPEARTSLRIIAADLHREVRAGDPFFYIRNDRPPGLSAPICVFLFRLENSSESFLVNAMQRFHGVRSGDSVAAQVATSSGRRLRFSPEPT